jgi:hypothetical protein
MPMAIGVFPGADGSLLPLGLGVPEEAVGEPFPVHAPRVKTSGTIRARPLKSLLIIQSKI